MLLIMIRSSFLLPFYEETFIFALGNFNFLQKYFKTTINVMALKLPSILWPTIKNIIAKSHRIAPFIWLCNPFRLLLEINNTIPVIYMGAPIACKNLLRGCLWVLFIALIMLNDNDSYWFAVYKYTTCIKYLLTQLVMIL